MHRIGVGGGVHRDGGDPQLFGGAKDTKRDFATIGDEDLVEHQPAYSITRSGSPYSTG